ncbi:hypothetical protein HG531_012895 [Fusarium graminearum]|nr:hypothetical protein HG531_012895 [Fusarium graminearum]
MPIEWDVERNLESSSVGGIWLVIESLVVVEVEIGVNLPALLRVTIRGRVGIMTEVKVDIIRRWDSWGGSCRSWARSIIRFVLGSSFLAEDTGSLHSGHAREKTNWLDPSNKRTLYFERVSPHRMVDRVPMYLKNCLSCDIRPAIITFDGYGGGNVISTGGPRLAFRLLAKVSDVRNKGHESMANLPRSLEEDTMIESLLIAPWYVTLRPVLEIHEDIGADVLLGVKVS